ncbi:MAG: hypothetical protein U1D67_06455 [Dehalococcoidia bacterium]|nr:hypothetical protein [Dehalococcoidia bacterium]MDZ4246739.1 hypothetical protein [Dehalococcoidia bacterium]
MKDFPDVLADLMVKHNVLFFDAYYPSKPVSSFELEPVTPDMITRVHSPEMVEKVNNSGVYLGAMYSAAGTVAAGRRIWNGEIDNAFIFTGYGDHHAGSNFFGGGCYFNGAAIAIKELQKAFGARRFAIIDTDAHHGDGSWELFESDPDVMYFCFCPGRDENSGNNFNIQLPWPLTSDKYLKLVRQYFIPAVKSYQPEAIFWNWGYDGTVGEYGDMGLPVDFHAKLASELKETADKICSGRLITVLCGGQRRDYAARLIPEIIKVLAGPDISCRGSTCH